MSPRGRRSWGIYTPTPATLCLRAAPRGFQFPGTSYCPIHWFQKTPECPGMQRLAAGSQQVHPKGHGYGSDSVRLSHSCTPSAWKSAGHVAHAQPTPGDRVRECGGAKTEMHENDDIWEVGKQREGGPGLHVDSGCRAPLHPHHHQQSYCLRAQVLDTPRTSPSSVSAR